MEKKRDETIDILRGMAIILVIIGHILYTPHVIRAWLYTFHVPLFFLCSGILFAPDHYPRFRDFLLSRVRSLLIPLFSLGVLTWLCQVGMTNLICLNPVISPDFAVPFDPVKQILSLLLGDRTHTYYFSLWFLYALFLGELLFYFLVKLIKRRWYGYVLLMLFGMGLQYLISQHVEGTYWSVDLLPVCICFLAAGFLYRLLFFEKKKKLPTWLLPVFALLSLLFFWLNRPGGDQVNLFYEQIGNPLFYLIAALSGSLLCMILAQLLGVCRPLEFFGRNSLVSYAFQNQVFIPMMLVLVNLLSNRNEELFSGKTFKWIVSLCATLLLCVLFSVLINRIAPWMAGKRRRR